MSVARSDLVDGFGSPEALRTIVTAIAVALGVSWTSRRGRIPPVIPLLGAGLLVGVSGLGLVRPAALGSSLRDVVALAVAIVLFEAGLARGAAGSRTVRRLAVVGAVVTWVVVFIAATWLVRLDAEVAALLAGVLVITGPTVVLPIIRHARVTAPMRTILAAEAIVLEPVGVFMTLFALEWITATTRGPRLGPLALLGARLLVGVAVGASGAAVLRRVAGSRVLTREQVGPVVVIGALVVFALAEQLASHAGLLAAIVAGVAFGRHPMPRRLEVAHVAGRWSELAVALLFVFLAAGLSLGSFRALGPREVLFVLAVVLVARPLAVLVATAGGDTTFREKAFASWVAPRGVVTATLAVACAELAVGAGHPEAREIEPIVLAVVLVTVVIQGGTARPLARWLGLAEPEREGWVVTGADELGLEIARALRGAGVTVAVFDARERHARRDDAGEGEALHVPAPSAARFDQPDFAPFGHLLGLLDDPVQNRALAREWRRAVPFGTSATWDDVRDLGDLVSAGTAEVSTALVHGELEILLVSAEDARKRPNVALLATKRGRARAAPRRVRASERAVVLARRRPSPARLFRAAIRIRAPEFASACRQLIDLAAKRAPDLDPDLAMAELFDRERFAPMSVVVGDDNAIAHLYTPAVPMPACWVGVLREPVRSAQGLPVRMLFLLLSPPVAPLAHVRALARIARCVRDEGMLDEMRSAESSRQMLDALEREHGRDSAAPPAWTSRSRATGVWADRREAS